MGSLDAREVLAYLNELGYQNITTKQLKEFMKDLKKLIKYEKKRKQTQTENIVPPATSCQYNRFASSHLAPTQSSKAKEILRNDQIVSVQIKRPVHTCHPQCHDPTVNKQPYHIPHDSQVSSDHQELHLEMPEATNDFNVEEKDVGVSLKRSKSCEPECQKPRSRVKVRGNALRPKASFIVPRMPVKTSRSDPVALYHKYQEGWKRQKLPGEDNHSELRWAIRERMLGQPRVMSAAPSMEAIARKRKTSNRI